MESELARRTKEIENELAQVLSGSKRAQLRRDFARLRPEEIQILRAVMNARQTSFRTHFLVSLAGCWQDGDLAQTVREAFVKALAGSSESSENAKSPWDNDWDRHVYAQDPGLNEFRAHDLAYTKKTYHGASPWDLMRDPIATEVLLSIARLLASRAKERGGPMTGQDEPPVVSEPEAEKNAPTLNDFLAALPKLNLNQMPIWFSVPYKILLVVALPLILGAGAFLWSVNARLATLEERVPEGLAQKFSEFEKSEVRPIREDMREIKATLKSIDDSIRRSIESPQPANPPRGK